MPKILFIIFLFASLLFGNNLNQKVRILSSTVTTNDNILIAKGNVVIYSNKYYISADKAIYNKELETFELFGDVLIIKDNKIKTKSNYAFLDMKNDNILQNPTFLLDIDSKIWIDTNEVTKTKTEFSFGSAVISSCDCVDPMWSIRFSSGYYDVDDKFIHTFNARLYLKSIPLLYTPYFGFSTDRTRRTGLLNPTIAFSNKEGFTYFQSMYYAPQDNYDIEVTPQFKLKRGNGVYGYFRYKDSLYSSLKIKTGIFVEKGKYFKEEKLVNKKHYGWNFDYERSNLFSNNKENKDALYISLSYLNDIEYITLEGPAYKTSTGKKVESKINYYFDQSSYYYGLYFRYYLDKSIDSSTKKIVSNNKTLQQLPQIQAHKYVDTFLSKNLSYSLDATFTNKTRVDGLNAKTTEVVLPVSLNFSLFDDYINIDLKDELYLSRTSYSNLENNYKSAKFLENRQIINISSDLIKPYSSFIHAITLSSKFTFSNNLRKDGDIYNFDSSKLSSLEKIRNNELLPFSINETKKNISLSINQSFFSQKDLTQILNHKISQNFTYDKNDNIRLSNLENEVTFNYDNIALYNRLLYSNEDKKLIESSSSYKSSINKLSLELGHYKSIKTDNSNKEDIESSTIILDYKISQKYNIKYTQNYNIEDSLRSKESFTFGINDTCWALSIKFENELVASSSDNETIRQNIIYFNLELKPIGAIKQQYKINE